MGKTELAHRVVMREIMGRELTTSEVVHHINGLKYDNNPSNLQLMDVAEHSRKHKKPPEYITVTCAFCGNLVTKFKKDIVYKQAHGTENFYCNNVCAGKHKFAQGKRPPECNPRDDVAQVVIMELDNGLTGYAIAKKYGFNKKTVYNHINSINSRKVVDNPTCL